MPDFSSLLQAPAGQAPRPVTLTPGNYAGVIKSFELKEAPPGKDYTKIVRIHIGVTGWPDNVADEDKQQKQVDGSFRPIDLSKRQLRRDYYDNGLYRLDDLIRSCGIESNGRTYEEILPELKGAAVVAEVQQYMNQSTNELGNQIGNLTGQK